MKKKKPKKSPSKSSAKNPPKTSSPAKSSFVVDDPKSEAPDVVFDAQIGPQADVDAQQPRDAPDLGSPHPETTPSRAVIDAPSSDPPSSNIVLPTEQIQVTTVAPPQSSLIVVSDGNTTGDEKDSGETALSPTVEKADAKKDSLSSLPVIEPPAAVSIDEKGNLQQNNSMSLPVNDNLVPGLTSDAENVAPPLPQQSETKQLNVTTSASVAPANNWCNLAKGLGKQLSKKGEAFTLPSGEACVRIPNSVIEKNKKSWDSFVLGQFYSDPPSQGTLHNIVNGIWSKYYRDISVSKMEGFAFLFRIPNAATRNRVINQRLWQIEGQTMFVDKWEPGVVPTKPELTSAPIWLELRNVPFQFFNEDGLERIAGLVGDPKYLHPMTKNKTNLEVAKVWTIIDPRKPLPEAVNVQFDSGVISRVLVSSPWMPPICEICKEVGHTAKRCPSAPKPAKLCSQCNAKGHLVANCPSKRMQEPKGKKTRRGKSKDNQQWRVVKPSKETDTNPALSEPEQAHTEIAHNSKLGTDKDKVIGETSGTPSYLQSPRPRSGSGHSKSSQSEIPSDSSDVESSDSELEEGEFSKFEPDFEVVRNKKKFSGLKGNRGRSPIIN